MNIPQKLMRIAAGVLVAVTLLISAGCDNGTDPDPVVPATFIGVWQMTTIIMYETPIGTMTIPAAQFLAMSGTGAAKSILEFKEDGTASVLTTYDDNSQDTIAGTWTEQGDSLTVSGAGLDDTVQWKAEATKLTLTRVMAINFTPESPKQDIVVDMVYTRVE